MKNRRPSVVSLTAVAPVAAAIYFFLTTTFAAANAARIDSNANAAKSHNTSHLETYKDLIQKAQNLTLQRDRLQTSQVLVRALQREVRGSPAFKELRRTLDELTGVFYTEKAQTAFVAGESQMLSQPKAAIASLQDALKIEDGNVAILKALVRTNLIIGDCGRAEMYLQTAENLHPFSGEIKLLRLQTLSCNKNYTQLANLLNAVDADLEPFDRFVKPLLIEDYLRRKDLRKAKQTQAQWETSAPDQPEAFYWRWEISRQMEAVDRSAAIKYVQLCQGLTPRKKKALVFDVDLCRRKEKVDQYLRDSSLNASPAPDETGGTRD